MEYLNETVDALVVGFDELLKSCSTASGFSTGLEGVCELPLPS